MWGNCCFFRVKYKMSYSFMSTCTLEDNELEALHSVMVLKRTFYLESFNRLDV